MTLQRFEQNPRVGVGPARLLLPVINRTTGLLQTLRLIAGVVRGALLAGRDVAPVFFALCAVRLEAGLISGTERVPTTLVDNQLAC